MKNIFLILFAFLFTMNSFGATCSSISRSANAANSVLTSTKYNLDHDTAYNFLNAYDFGCGTAGTLEKDALNTTDFAVVQSAPKTGCTLSYLSASTLNVGPCRISIDNDYSVTTTNTQIAFGCSGCSGEVATADYYVYATTSSTATSLDLRILTTVPNGDGYTSTSRVLGKFYNNGVSDIDPNSMMQFTESRFMGDLSGAGLYGSVKWAPTTNCRWSGTSATMADYSADTDCDDLVRVAKRGTVHTTQTAPGHADGRVPQIKFSSMPAGIYYVIANGFFYSGDGASNNCAYRFSDGTNFTSIVNIGQATSNHYAPNIMGMFVYTTDQTSVTIQIQQDLVAGTACYVDSGADSGLEILVFRYPLIF